MDDKFQIKEWINRLKFFSIHPTEKIAVYGTGDGAKTICNVLKEMGIFENVIQIIDRDESPKIGSDEFGRKICRLKDCYLDVDTIIVGAFKCHVIIRERLENFCINNTDSKFRIIDLFSHNTQIEELAYIHYIEKEIMKEPSPNFVKFNNTTYTYIKGDTRVIAWYLPQYHEMEINNKLWGKGFTEWTNTTRAFPLYVGHYQPHIPYDVGYYNLNNAETFARQIELAHHYGIYGFSFYYYWFSGKRFMEKPLEIFLEHKELDINFCITWANENWTTLWDGGQNEIIYRQEIDNGDAYRFIDDLVPVISDYRYITIDGKPLIVIYRGNIFDKKTMATLLYDMRKRAKFHGFKDLYILITNAGNFDDTVDDLGADALVEFPPHGMNHIDVFRPQGYINPYFVGKIYNASRFIAEKCYMMKHKEQKYYRAALTSWDNTARKARSGAQIYHGLSPETFKQWLWDIVTESKKIHSGEHDMVFVNSWNEWGEGSHLEPDMKYGYAYLDVVKEVVENTRV